MLTVKNKRFSLFPCCRVNLSCNINENTVAHPGWKQLLRQYLRKHTTRPCKDRFIPLGARFTHVFTRFGNEHTDLDWSVVEVKLDGRVCWNASLWKEHRFSIQWADLFRCWETGPVISLHRVSWIKIIYGKGWQLWVTWCCDSGTVKITLAVQREHWCSSIK